MVNRIAANGGKVWDALSGSMSTDALVLLAEKLGQVSGVPIGAGTAAGVECEQLRAFLVDALGFKGVVAVPRVERTLPEANRYVVLATYYSGRVTMLQRDDSVESLKESLRLQRRTSVRRVELRVSHPSGESITMMDWTRGP